MSRKAASLCLFLVLAVVLSSGEAKDRHFTFDYTFTVRITEPGKPLDIWFPMAQSDRFQQVKILSRTSDLPLQETQESEYGNRMFYAHTDKADKAEYHFSVKYDVVRHEHLAGATGREAPSAVELSRFLQPDRLVPVSGRPAEIAASQVTPAMTVIQQARALYNYTFANMKYDKSGTGWGHGDTLWACDAKRGNCTDFHSLFISLARSRHIPAKFEIGFPLPASEGSGQIPGYHCWAEFYVAGRGWVPVDISEAWLHPAKKDYFFGANDANRIQFSVGRDLELSPRQHDQPVNYFVYPYVELGNRAYPNVDNAFSFADVVLTQNASSMPH